jgi:hypothetical protein
MAQETAQLEQNTIAEQHDWQELRHQALVAACDLVTAPDARKYTRYFHGQAWLTVLIPLHKIPYDDIVGIGAMNDGAKSVHGRIHIKGYGTLAKIYFALDVFFHTFRQRHSLYGIGHRDIIFPISDEERQRVSEVYNERQASN